VVIPDVATLVLLCKSSNLSGTPYALKSIITTPPSGDSGSTSSVIPSPPAVTTSLQGIAGNIGCNTTTGLVVSRMSSHDVPIKGELITTST
jgi:hypothetical protein